jgi:hypothetical protein
MLRMRVCCILTSSRITRSGSWKTDPLFLRWFCYNIEKASPKDGIIGVEHIDDIEGDVFCARVLWGTK